MAGLAPPEVAAPPRRRAGGPVRQAVRQAVLLLIGAALLALVLSRVTAADLASIVGQGRPLDLVAAALCAGAIYVIMPLRLMRSLAGAGLAFRPAFVVSLRQSLLLVLLPARAGDVAYPWLLARAASIPVGRAIANLVVIRLCDLTVLCLAAAVGVTVLFNGSFNDGGDYSGFLYVVLALAAVGLAALVYMADLFAAASRAAASMGLARTRLHRWLFEAGRGARLLPRHRLAEVLGWTLLRWAVSMVFLWLVFHAFGLTLGTLEVVFVSAVLNVVAIVPIQTFGSFGVAEGALTVALVALGVDPAKAAATALVARATWLVLVVATGGALLAGARVVGPRQRRTS